MATNIENPALPGDDGSLAFRRVKPLPKRRRTAALSVHPQDYSQQEVNSFSFQDPHALAALADLHARPYFSQLNAQQAIRGLFTSENDADSKVLADFTGLYGSSSVPSVIAPVPDTDDQLESDYVDHLQLPTNTKKRKVPGLNRSRSQGGNAVSSASGAGLGLAEDQPEVPINEGALQLAAHRLLVDGPEEGNALGSSIRPPESDASRKFPRGSLVTRAGLQHKALVNTRKKQFAAVLDDFPEGDSLALEQALTARYPQLEALFDPKAAPYYRFSRKAALKKKSKPLGESKQANVAAFSSDEFAFMYPSTTSERMASTRREAERLKARFEEELARQALRAVEAAAKVAASVMEPPPKNRKRVAGSTRTGFPMPPRLDSDSISGDQGLLGKGGRQKKKKRSALANASNPHHLRNYIPSRLPQQPPPLTQASLAAANLLSPPPLKFLSAQIPPKRRKRGAISQLGPAPLTNPLDEWICPNCEYSLFYGDEAGFRRSVRNRKKILSRRRRARERAAAAAAGLPAMPEKNAPLDQAEHEYLPSVVPTIPLVQSVVKKDRQITAGDDTLK